MRTHLIELGHHQPPPGAVGSLQRHDLKAKQRLGGKGGAAPKRGFFTPKSPLASLPAQGTERNPAAPKGPTGFGLRPSARGPPPALQIWGSVSHCCRSRCAPKLSPNPMGGERPFGPKLGPIETPSGPHRDPQIRPESLQTVPQRESQVCPMETPKLPHTNPKFHLVEVTPNPPPPSQDLCWEQQGGEVLNVVVGPERIAELLHPPEQR